MHGNFGDFAAPKGGAVLAGRGRSAVVANARARQHTVNGGGWLMAMTGFACLAVISGLSGDVLGTLLLIAASVWCVYRAKNEICELSEASFDAGQWVGVARGRLDMEREIERGMWAVELNVRECVR